MNNILVGE